MDKNEPTQISSLSDFIEWINQLGSEKYLFRGVPNAEYKIQASAFRRLKAREDVRRFEKFLQINRDLITDINRDLIADARLRGHGERDGRELGDLEILAQLQHFGAATCLIDFTLNAQVALYFACQKDLKSEKNSQDSENPPDGKVYAVRNDLLKLKKVTPDLLKEKIDYFFPSFQPNGRDQLYRWEPGYQNNRIIAQQSTFVFGDFEFDENDACIIEESCKEDILIELEQVSGINEAMLFPDFDGFARLHREEIPYIAPSASDYLERANQALQSNQYEEAILNYDKAIELDSQDSEAYHWRALAKRGLGQNDDAIDDYNKMVDIDSSPRAYQVRGEVLLELEQYQQAIADFDKMVDIDGSPCAYQVRGEVLLELEQYQQAIADFDKIIELAPDDSFGYILRGKAKCGLRQHQEAIADFNTALQINPDDVSIYQLQAETKEHIGDMEGAKEDSQMALTLMHKRYIGNNPI